MTFGSDWPAAGYVSTDKPLDTIEDAVTRQLRVDHDRDCTLGRP